MAVKPLRPCREPGCRALTNGGYCPDHTPQKASKTESATWHWMYNTSKWRKELRPAQLLREPWCCHCTAEGRRNRATRVDHKTPHKGDWVLFVSPHNHQSLCESHHNRKTALEIAQERKSKRFL